MQGVASPLCANRIGHNSRRSRPWRQRRIHGSANTSSKSVRDWGSNPQSRRPSGHRRKGGRPRLHLTSEARHARRSLRFHPGPPVRSALRLRGAPRARSNSPIVHCRDSFPVVTRRMPRVGKRFRGGCFSECSNGIGTRCGSQGRRRRLQVRRRSHAAAQPPARRVTAERIAIAVQLIPLPSHGSCRARTR